MRHITAEGLDCLGPFLDELRQIPELREKKRGVFYRKSRAFLHFHEESRDLFADVRLGTEFERYRTTTRAEQRALLRTIRKALR